MIQKYYLSNLCLDNLILEISSFLEMNCTFLGLDLELDTDLKIP